MSEPPKIAFIILCHKWIDQLHRMVSRLDGPNRYFFVHVSKRTDDAECRKIMDGLKDFERLEFVRREPVRWGDIGMVLSSLSGIEAIVKHKEIFDVVSFHTPQDYPIKPAEEMDAFFRAHAGKSFLTHRPIPSPEAWPAERNGLDRIEYWHFRKPGRDRIYPEDHIVFPRRGSFGKAPISWLWDAFVTCFPFKRRFLKGYKPYGGDCYWTMSGDAARYINELVQTEPKIIRFFKTVFIPDEFFYQTLLMNSPLKDTVVDDDLRHIDWTKRPSGGPPAFLDETDIETLRSSSHLFARKFDLGRHPDILDVVDRELLNLG